MFTLLFQDKRVLARLHGSCLGAALADLAGDLQGRGYARQTIRIYLCVAEHFGRWLTRRHIVPWRVTDEDVRRFIHEHLPKCSCASPVARELGGVRRGLRQLLKVLNQSRPTSRHTVNSGSPIDQELQAYDAYLTDVCGLAEETRQHRRYYVGQFLRGRFRRAPLQLVKLQASDLTKFITGIAKRWRPRTARAAAVSLRSYFRFLQLRGFKVRSLMAAIPRLPEWRLAGIPQTFTKEQLQLISASFDLSTAVGCRDYAIVQCLAGLGLRCEEVALLKLDDVDWRDSSILVFSGKVRRARRLPMPTHVGRAIAAYLRKHRSRSGIRHLFVRHCSLVGRPVNREIVRGVVRRALKRAGLCAAGFGSHTFRRTFATKMVQQGVPLKLVADLLGHRSIDTTVIYTKVDLPRLCTVPMPWPEVQS
jgi:integrase/recombinase XerD